MSKLPPVLQNLSLPVIASPLFIISNPKLVIEQCKAGVVGSMPALNARPAELLDVIDFVAAGTKAQPNAVFAGSVPYLMLAGNVVAGWQLARSLLVAQDLLQKGQDEAFMRAKITTAQFYADHILVKAPGLRDSIVEGAASVTELALEAF